MVLLPALILECHARNTYIHTDEMRIEELTVRIVVFCWPFRGALSLALSLSLYLVCLGL